MNLPATTRAMLGSKENEVKIETLKFVIFMMKIR